MQTVLQARWHVSCVLFFSSLVAGSSVLGIVALADNSQSLSISWSLRESCSADKARSEGRNAQDEDCWFWLRTTAYDGPVESRRWLRDGRYATLTDAGDKLFDSPVQGRAFRASPAMAPLIGSLTAEYNVGLKFQTGEVLIAPGPDHAAIIGWRSPVSGILDIEGSFEHGQACCGLNSQIAWYVERGSSPNVEQGFQSIQLASGTSDFGSANQLSQFRICDQTVIPGDFIYFIVDALADGSTTPHYGDATRVEISLTVRDAQWPSPPRFEKDIQPILARSCFECHGEGQTEANLDLRSVSEMLRGGESGPAIVRGSPHESLMLDLVTSGQMPPEDSAERPTLEEIALLRRWIKAGSPADEAISKLPVYSQVTEQDRSFWAFQSPVKSAVPQVKGAANGHTIVDRFLLEKLQEKGLSFSPNADKQTLIRRAYLDLIGLPPHPSAVQAFLSDTRPNAYEQLIEDLLKSPHYGERWGRHWLDAAGYVDGKLDNDLGSIYPHIGIWRYRDYVIQCFNEDKPYNQFLTEQIAGDELVDWRRAETFDARTISLLTATGFLRNVDDHTDFPQYGIEKRYEVVNETLDMFSTALLGLTMECCRCHNHKYDPLPQRDYYRLMACFEPSLNPHTWKPPKDRYLADVSASERSAIDQRNAEIDKQVSELTNAEAMLRSQVRTRIHSARLATIPESIREDVRLAVEMKPEQRSDVHKYLAEKFTPLLTIAENDIDTALDDTEKRSLKSSADQRASLLSQKRTYGVIQALWDVGPPPISHVHRRGNVKAHGVLVQPGFPEVLQPKSLVNFEVPEELQGQSSGRRLALARWLTEPSHPLTARVLVNRVWHHHFGRGIVETLGNFGSSGSLPSHPELLDWLAVDFIENGWSIKRLHRQIVLSTAYRQSSGQASYHAGIALSPQDRLSTEMHKAQEIDPANRLLWRMNLRRLEAEIVRDCILAVSGSLDLTAGGPPVEISNPANGLSEAKNSPTPTSHNRRSVYLFARRVYPLKFLEIFDAPIMPVNCTQRTNSANVLQSLAVLNSEFLFSAAEKLATRISETATPSIEQQVKLGFQLSLGRSPTTEELERSLAFLNDQQRSFTTAETPEDNARQLALADFCQMLMSSNEFLYVE